MDEETKETPAERAEREAMARASARRQAEARRLLEQMTGEGVRDGAPVEILNG